MLRVNWEQFGFPDLADWLQNLESEKPKLSGLAKIENEIVRGNTNWEEFDERAGELLNSILATDIHILLNSLSD